MSEIIMKFNLPEESDEFTMAHRGNEFYVALFAIDQACRGSLKYGHSFKTPDEVLEWVREQIPDLEDIS